MTRSLLFVLFYLGALQMQFAQNYSQAEVAEDLNYLQGQLRGFHPGFNRYAPPGELDQAFQNMKQKGVASPLELFKRVRFLISKVKCGHTNASFSRKDYDSFVQSRLFLPVMVRFSGETLYVVNASLTKGVLHNGEKILSVNGKAVKEIVDAIFEHLPSDGFIETGKHRYTETFFYYYHQLFADSARYDKFLVEVTDRSGSSRTVEIQGEELSVVESIRETDSSPLMQLEHFDQYSYLKIRTFSSSELNRAGIHYSRFLANAFDDLKKKKVQNLILDLRGNGGGDDDYGATLVSYFADKPFRYFANIQVTDAYKGYGKIEKRNGVRYMTSHDGLDIWKPEKDRFAGKVVVLTDGFSFSTCADVAAVLHHHKWATFIGEETGGGYDGNTSGSTTSITLPNSQIQVRIPMWMYTTANIGHEFHGRGVIPDLPVQNTIDDLIQDNDPVLQKAIELFKKPGR